MRFPESGHITMGPIALLMIASLAQTVTTDRTIPVRPGMRLHVDLAAGTIVVRGEDRQDVRIVATHSRDVQPVIDPGATQLTVRTGRRPGTLEYQIAVPRAMPITVGRGDVNVDVAGVTGEIAATVRDGTVSIDGGRGLISVQTAHGAISVKNAHGRIVARTLNSDIRIADSSGDIEVEGSDGDIALERLDANSADVSTVDGWVAYEGSLKPNGHYTFATHDQGVRLSIPATTGATITIATVTGQARSDFPFASRKDLGKGQFSFVVGDGAAQVSLSSFEGLVEVRRLTGKKN
jgi:ribosomal protein L6P/L9E